MLSSLVKFADEVVQILHPAGEQSRRIVLICGRIDVKNQSSANDFALDRFDANDAAVKWLRKQMEDNSSKLERLMSSTAAGHQEILTRFDTIGKRYDEEDRLKILSWLSTIPYMQHHKRTYSEVLTGTGAWFLEDAQYISWRESDRSAMLWLHGIPGSGKSKLMYVDSHFPSSQSSWLVGKLA